MGRSELLDNNIRFRVLGAYGVLTPIPKMWYEILPSFGIIVISMAMPHAASYVANKLCLDNYFRRQLLERHQRMQYMRDTRLTGNPYVIKGLDNIPD